MNAQEIIEAAKEKGGERFHCKNAMWVTEHGQIVDAGTFAARWELPKSLPASFARKFNLTDEQGHYDADKPAKTESAKPADAPTK